MGLHVFGVGRLTADPERPTNGPAKFRLAVDDYNSQTKQREATFWDCAAWGKTGDTVMQYTNKGKQVAINGRIKTRRYTANNGQEREVAEITVENLELLGDGKAGSGNGGNPSQQGNPTQSTW
jgi:single-strand DNA-binding protein